MTDRAMLVSPTEPAAVKSLGRVSPFPERVGADVAWIEKGRIYGCQRKELSDLISSLGDRLPREAILLNQKTDVALLIIEGRPTFTRDGQLVSDYGQPFSKNQLRRLIFSIQSTGIWVVQTESIEDTVVAILDLHEWAKKDQHKSLVSRTKPTRGAWGPLTKKDQDAFVLQSFEGIGPIMARRLVDHFGGLPISFTFTEEELAAVPGIGPKRARGLMRSLPIDPAMVSVVDVKPETKKRRVAS